MMSPKAQHWKARPATGKYKDFFHMFYLPNPEIIVRKEKNLKPFKKNWIH